MIKDNERRILCNILFPMIYPIQKFGIRWLSILESFCYRIQYSVFLCIHTRVHVETIIKQLELLTRNDETKRLLIISISDTAKMPIWCNDESFLIKEESVIVV